MDNPTSIAQDVQIKQLILFRHKNRMADIRLPKVAMNSFPNGKKKKRKTQKKLAE